MKISFIIYFVSGFPRTVVQAEKLSEKQELDVVVNLNVPFETIIDRISVSSINCKKWVEKSRKWHLILCQILLCSYKEEQFNLLGELSSQSDVT